MSSKCITGTLTIGIIDGLNISGFVPTMVDYFEKQYPNIRIILNRVSFKALLEGLNNGNLDAAVSFDFHYKEQPDLYKINLIELQPAFAVPVRNPLSKKKHLLLRISRMSH